MIGLVGVIGKTSAVDRRSLAVMPEPSPGEPDWSVGNLVVEELGLAVGWSVRRGSFGDCLPIWNERRDLGLIWFGEEYAGDKLRASLGGKHPGLSFDTAEYVLRGYEEFGSALFPELNGWFVGVLIDRRRSEVILFNDRFGLRRIYWGEDESAFYFASEAKALLRLRPQWRQIQSESLGELVSCGCTLQDRSLFRGLTLLPRAACWSFAPGRSARREEYFRPSTWEQQSPIGAEQYYSELRDLFEKRLPLYLGGRQEVAVSLTGGLDGRMIMAWARRAPGTLRTYTFGGPYRECGDVKLARRVATLCGQPHQVIPVGDGFFREFPDLARKAVLVSDGTMDLTGAVELYVNRLAREIAPVRLTGNYGSEIVRGNVAFRPRGFVPGLFDPGFEPHLRNAESTYAAERQGHPVTFIAFKQVPWHHQSRFTVEQAELTPRSPFLDNDLVALMYRAPRASIDGKDAVFRLVTEGQPALGPVPTDRGLRERPVPLVTPLQHLWQEFTFRAEYAYDYGMPQWVAGVDHVLAPLHLERLFLGRHKFCHFRIWYRDRLAATVRDLLLDPRSLSRSYLRPAKVKEVVVDHLAGRRNYTSEIHLLLGLELIHRELIERG